MTISSQTREAGPFVGNSTTTVFPFAFKVFQSSDLYVVRLVVATGVQSTLIAGTDYTVVLNSDQNASPGGTVTVPVALATGYTLTVTSLLSYLQATDLTNAGGFYPSVINDALDRLTIFVQQLVSGISRSLRFPLSDGASINTTLPGAAARAGKVLTFDSTGAPAVAIAATDVAAVAANAANINAVAGDLTNINLAAANLTAINAAPGSATAAASSASAASTSSSAASTSASGASTSAASALASLNTFKGQYYGALASDPTVDPLGAAMTAGDLYLNTSVPEMRAYSGAAWVVAYVSSAGFVAKSGLTASAGIPAGTQAQRDVSPSAGNFRFNTDLSKFEGYNGAAWGSVGGGSTGGGSDAVFNLNGQTINSNFTIPSGQNASSVGTLAIASGAVVTISAGSTWAII